MANCKPIFYFISMIIFTTFFISVNSQQTAVSFNIDRFTPGDPLITLQGSASINNNGILRLINSQSPRWNTGRALYSRAVRIWDNNGNVASFITSFSFLVRNISGFNPADGFIFFLSSNPNIPSNSDGGQLGVVSSNDAFNNFVGVEFDTFLNRWDPRFPHIGIDVNSLRSVQTVRWNRRSGSLETVSIMYDAPSKTLSVLVTHWDGKISTVSQVVDLKAVLPQTVHVGLSATTSNDRQLTDVRSWSFSSNFGRINNHLGIIAEQK